MRKKKKHKKKKNDKTLCVETNKETVVQDESKNVFLQYNKTEQ